MFNTELCYKYMSLLKEKSPLIHCITNDVVINYTANVLLAIGASPAMVIAEEEAADFASIASALLINIGTITQPQANAMLKAVAAANKNQVPWVLDPVAYGALKFRSDICQQLLAYQPTIIRGNASEIYSLAGFTASSKGADSTMSSDEVLDAAISLAKQQKTVVAVTGKDDYITDGDDIYKLSNGSIKLTLVTGTGCSLSAMMSAYSAVCPTALHAAITAIAQLTLSAEIAANNTVGIGSFAVALMDNLSYSSDLSEGKKLLNCTKL